MFAAYAAPEAGGFPRIDVLGDLYRMGRAARAVPACVFPGLDASGSHGQAVAIDGSPICGACVHLASGFLGPRQTFGAHSLRVGGMPIAQRVVIPTETHYLVYPRASSAPNAAPLEVFATSLDQRTKGFFERRRVSLSWRSGPFAAYLDGDAWLMDTLWKHLLIDDRLDIRPDPAWRLVRIVHRRLRVANASLFASPQPSAQAIEPLLFFAIERIAHFVHAWAAPTAQ